VRLGSTEGLYGASTLAPERASSLGWVWTNAGWFCGCFVGGLMTPFFLCEIRGKSWEEILLSRCWDARFQSPNFFLRRRAGFEKVRGRILGWVSWECHFWLREHVLVVRLLVVETVKHIFRFFTIGGQHLRCWSLGFLKHQIASRILIYRSKRGSTTQKAGASSVRKIAGSKATNWPPTWKDAYLRL